MSTLVARSDMAHDVLSLYGLITWISVGIGVLVFAILGYVLFRFRDRPGAPLPPQTHGRPWLELAWTTGPALVLLIIAVPTLQVIFRTQSQAKPRDALEVVVRGYQWWWEFAYPALGVVTANELHLPAGRRVVFRLEGPDVLHSFWVPKLGGKRDVVPGRGNTITMTPDTPSEFWGQCAEFCGTSHANMGLRVVVDADSAFETWARAEQGGPATPAPASPAERGKAIYSRSACLACHTIQGVSPGVIGPNLTHVGSRTTIAGGMFPNDSAHLARWIADATSLKPGSLMPRMQPPLSDGDIALIVAYLQSLR